ncbi:MAG: RhuM family protein [Glaciecola sp.]
MGDERVTRKDVSVTKNYLTQEELSELNQIVAMYLDFADLQAKKKVPMRMAQ